MSAVMSKTGALHTSGSNHLGRPPRGCWDRHVARAFEGKGDTRASRPPGGRHQVRTQTTDE
eukprot:2838177-Pyramimonas_sp.AAC.1